MGESVGTWLCLSFPLCLFLYGFITDMVYISLLEFILGNCTHEGHHSHFLSIRIIKKGRKKEWRKKSNARLLVHVVLLLETEELSFPWKFISSFAPAYPALEAFKKYLNIICKALIRARWCFCSQRSSLQYLRLVKVCPFFGNTRTRGWECLKDVCNHHCNLDMFCYVRVFCEKKSS